MLLRLEAVLDQAEIAEVRRIVESAKWIDGSVSGDPALKKNLQADRATPEFDKAIKKVVGALMARPEFKSYAIPKQVTLEFNRYDPGMFYKNHMDAALMGGVRGQPMRADLSFTVALTDPAAYKGGDFVAETPFGEERMRLEAGNAIIYPSSMIHRVEPIEEGTRWAAIGWIQSMVRDENRREILFEIDRLRDAVTRQLTDPETRERFDRLRGNLVRLWAEV